MKLADGTDLTSRARFEHPDDGNADDRTVMRVPLPQPVAAGASIALVIEWHAKLPRVFARTGYRRDYYLVGQWFPKIAVYEPAGTRGRIAGGWNCHQFHANTEFYADFGRYRVNITTPAAFVVGATGQRTGCAHEHRRHDDLHVRAGGRARLRVDGGSALRRDDRALLGAGDVTPAEYARRPRSSAGRSTRCGCRTWRSGC